jgi:hypothetical protein
MIAATAFILKTAAVIDRVKALRFLVSSFIVSLFNCFFSSVKLKKRI